MACAPSEASDQPGHPPSLIRVFAVHKSSQMLLNQTNVEVDEELEKVIITIYSSTETDIGDNEYASGETTETSSETEACLQLGLRMHTVPNVAI